MAVFTYDENGQYTKLVAAFPCAIGRSARMTALGVFEISSKGPWKRWNSSQYSPYYTKYTSGVFIHGPIYRSKKFDTLLYKSYNSIGSTATSGCIRTTVEAAKFVYFECPAGTVIEVVLSSDLVDRIEKIALDEEYPRWDPTDPEKPASETEAEE
jgi:lipoprotein-anchoring transpeptidase ErfK/SrfK